MMWTCVRSSVPKKLLRLYCWNYTWREEGRGNSSNNSSNLFTVAATMYLLLKPLVTHYKYFLHTYTHTCNWCKKKLEKLEWKVLKCARICCSKAFVKNLVTYFWSLEWNKRIKSSIINVFIHLSSTFQERKWERHTCLLISRTLGLFILVDPS